MNLFLKYSEIIVFYFINQKNAPESQHSGNRKKEESLQVMVSPVTSGGNVFGEKRSAVLAVLKESSP